MTHDEFIGHIAPIVQKLAPMYGIQVWDIRISRKC